MDTYDTIAWQVWDQLRDVPGRWSKMHHTKDNGVTTLCGKTVMIYADTDSTSPEGTCKKCFKLKRSGK